MKTDEKYERYGLGGNPFEQLSTQRLATISRSHANLSIDDQLGDVKASVFHQKQKALITLIGREGFGKTERILVAAKEAENNNLFHAVFQVEENMRCAMEGLLQSLSPKGSTLLSNDKWEREIAGLKKKVRKGYDPGDVGTAIAAALNSNVPCFLLIDDLHRVLNAADSQLFFQTLSVVIQKSIPGVFLLATVDEATAFPQPVVNLVQSMRTHSFRLHPATLEDAEKIVSKQLQSQRLVDGISSTYPFTVEAVQRLNETAHGNPLLLLSCANVVLTAAAMQKTISITDDITTDALTVIQKQSWYQNLSSLVLDRSVRLPMLIPQGQIKEMNQRQVSSKVSDTHELTATSYVEKKPSKIMKKQQSKMADRKNGSQNGKTKKSDKKGPAEPEINKEMKPVNENSHPDNTAKKGKDFETDSKKGVDKESNILSKQNMVIEKEKSSVKQNKINKNQKENSVDESENWEKVKDSEVEKKQSSKKEEDDSTDSSNFVGEEKSSSADAVKTKHTSMPENQHSRRKKDGEKEKIPSSSDSGSADSISKQQYSYQPEVGLVDIGPSSLSALPTQENTINHYQYKDHRQEKEKNNEDPENIDKHKKEQLKETSENEAVSKMTHNDNPTDNTQSGLAEQKPVKIDTPDGHGSRMRSSIPRIKKQDSEDVLKKNKDRSVRVVKVKCPECDQIFTSELSDDKKQLHCPFCGFTGGY